MAVRPPRYTNEVYAQKGTEIYETQVRQLVEEGNKGKIVAIDVDSGAFELADNGLTAAHRLFARYPDAQIWCVRIGYPAVHKYRHRITP
jgi:hypothetical protein